MNIFVKHCLIAFLAIMILGGCSHSVKRIDPSSQTDLSGRWNDTDSRLTANAMIEQMFGKPWAIEFEQRHQKKPVIIVGLVNNKSHEHINTETFIKDLERAIVNTGSICLVEKDENREALRRERADQQEFASAETAKRWARELGADFLLQGSVNSIVDSYKKNQVVFYQIDLTLSNIENNVRVWQGQEKIKKMIRN